MARTAPQRRTGRRSPVTSAALLLIGLLATGGVYAAFTSAAAASTQSTSSITTMSTSDGQKLFAANCASCHGLAAQGTSQAPSLIGAGAAAVDFQVGTGRMPMAAQGPQAQEKPTQFTDEQVKELAAWVATLGTGPAIPSKELTNGQGDVAVGAELFRINCAMCHNVAGAGGALTEGKYAPALKGVTGAHIYEAMVTGPQNMPVFNDMNISSQNKKNIIAYLDYVTTNASPGGLDLEDLGPVSEGLFAWIFVLGSIIGITVWLTAKAN